MSDPARLDRNALYASMTSHLSVLYLLYTYINWRIQLSLLGETIAQEGHAPPPPNIENMTEVEMFYAERKHTILLHEIWF